MQALCEINYFPSFRIKGMKFTFRGSAEDICISIYVYMSERERDALMVELC